MNKLNQTFKINPLYETDGYKVGHKAMLAKGTTRLYGTWIPRNLKHMPLGINQIMSAGQQLVVRYLHSSFEENFFSKDISVATKFSDDMAKYLGMPYDGKHFEELHELGYLPIKVKSLPEGLFTNPNIPHMTFVNTVDGYAWLTLFLETFISKLAWQMPTAATIAHKFRENANFWVQKTDSKNLWLTDFMLHDFHSRGGNPFTSIAVGLGHALTNKGSDTLNVIPAAEYYYDETEMPIFSVNASEHSVSTTKIFTCGEKQMIIDWLKEFPTGILSIVADTFDLWKLITEYLADAEVKALILTRDGKLVIRPDSGDPVDIICGTYSKISPKQSLSDGIGEFTKKHVHETKGVIELLWDIFGGTINEQGYKVLDSHIGAIYGDSINLERQIAIYTRLANKSFASTNIVLGVGSYTYVMLTRDSAGYAAKGSWFEVEENEVKIAYNIYKDPITDDGSKRSLKGLISVVLDDSTMKDECKVLQECTWEEESEGLLQTIYEDGKFSNQTTLTQIRERLKQL